MSLNQMFTFLHDLERNNSFAWMQEHQPSYQQAKQTCLSLAQELVFALGKEDHRYFDIDVKKRMSRLVRDTRFSKDKRPYQPRFMLHLSPFGKEPIPCGPFLCIKSGSSMVGGGLFLSTFAPATHRIRTFIYDHPSEFLALVDNLEQQGIQILGEARKRVPKEFDPASAVSPYLKYKSWYVEVTIPNREAETVLLHDILHAIKMIQPLNDFLNEALGELRLPKRP